jgi:large subunit ribosomal protein L17
MSHNHHNAKQHKLRNSKKHILASLVRALLLHESIQTTIKRAQALRMVVEPLITLGKKAHAEPERALALRRQLFSVLKDKALVTKVFTEIAPRYLATPGGYTRINRTHIRSSDATTIVQIQFS